MTDIDIKKILNDYNKQYYEWEQLSLHAYEELFIQTGNLKILDQFKKVLIKHNYDVIASDMSKDELEISKAFVNVLRENLLVQKLCKVIPQSEIIHYLNFSKSIEGFFARKSDILKLLEGNKQMNYIDVLYTELGLDYPQSLFESTDDYVGLLKLEPPRELITIPVDQKLNAIMDDTHNIIFNYNEYSKPFTGTSMTSGRNGVPEFFITSNKKLKNRDGYPLEAFSISIDLVCRTTNEIIEFAHFSNERIDGQLISEEFTIEDNKACKEAMKVLTSHAK